MNWFVIATTPPATEAPAGSSTGFVGEWLPMIIAILAAAFAGWQAFEARKARIEAGKSQTGAADSAKDAADAQRDSAAALADMARIAKEQHEAAQAAAAHKPDPWSLSAGSFRRNGEAAILSLGGSDTLEDIELTFERAPSILHLDPDPVPTTMRPGDAIEIYWMKTMGDSSTFVLEVHWRRPGDAERTVTRATIT